MDGDSDGSRQGETPSGTIDSFLRAVGRAPEVSPGGVEDSVPERIAHFRILGILGRGGMGVVFRATDEGLERTVALKVLQEASRSEEKRRRFLREARSAASITHPNVAVVYQVGEAGGRVYIAMELVEGESLRQRLVRGPLGAPATLDVARQIAWGLMAAHDEGIVHRDLKPENVFVTRAGVVKLLDFGLAKKLALAPSDVGNDGAAEPPVTYDDGRLMGTPEYMSPEQALGDPVDVRSDVFSFGVMLFEMIAGARPFTGASHAAVLRSIARDTPAPLSGRGVVVPPGLERVVERCLEKAPEARYPSARELAVALSALMPADTGQPSVAPARHGRAPGSVRRWRRGLAATAALAVLGPAGAGVVDGATRHGERGQGGAAASGGSTGVPITEHPAPRTRSPEAAAAYASALQNVRDGSVAMGRIDFERAAQIDPSLAEAHLRYVLYGADAPRTALREHASAAAQFRDALSERDAALLRVAEAEVADPPRPEEVVARAREAAERYATDAEVVWLHGNAIQRAGRTYEATPIYLQALDLDPRFAEALCETDYPDRALTLRNLERCLDISPRAASCLRTRDALYVERGRCEEFEADSRRLVVVEPMGPRAFAWRAMALAQERAPARRAVREAPRRSGRPSR